MHIFLIIVFLGFFGCATGDFTRHFIVKHHRDSTHIVFTYLADSLPQHGYQVRSIKQDSLFASTYIKQGSLNEREIQLLFIHQPKEAVCSVYVKTITYFRQDTIIEYFDEQRGFPASYRKDFMPIIQLAERIGKNTLRKKK
jgi:hypothetical protein